ncbi:unnamed protein product [Calypogeia fissa]
MASSSAAAGSASSVREDREEEDRAEERALTGFLSDDTLLHIMRCLSTRELLSSLAFVCHRWHRLCTSILVYELVPCPLNSSKRPWGNLRRKRLLELTVTHAPTLERVHLHGLKRIKSKDVIALCQSLPKLHDLSIISCPDFETTDLELTANQVPQQLISLDIHRDHVIAFPCTVNDKILANIHQRCPRLQKLDLDICSEITWQGLDGLLQACQLLTSLDLHSQLLGWPEVAQVFKSCKYLRHFSLVSPRLIPQTSGSSDDHEIRGRATKRWSRGGLYSSSEISLGVQMPKQLTSIRLYSSPHRSVPLEFPPMYEILFSNGHQVRQLHAQGLFNTSWEMISVWCANLKLLDLTHFSQNSLILTRSEEFVLCGLFHLLKQLEHIALPSATDRILTELGRFGANLREIRFLDTNSRNTLVTDKGVVAVAEGCPDLRVLSLSGCHKLTISSARALAFHCRKLEALILSRCDKFTDAAVAALLPRLHSSLILLDLIGCQITQSSLEALQQYAKVTSLRVVAIAKALWQRSQSVIADIHGCNPRLRIRNESGIVWDGFYHGTVIS